MQRDSHKLSPDQRLLEIAMILARGVVRMKDNESLLTSREKQAGPVLLKPSKPVNQRVSG